MNLKYIILQKKIYFITLLMFLGLPNPSQHYADKILTVALFGYVFLQVFRGLRLNKYLQIILIIIGLSIYYGNGIIDIKISVLGLALALTFQMLTFLASKNIKFGNLIPIFFIVFIFLLGSIINSQKLREYLAIDPPMSQYTHDMGLYLKTFYLMQNMDYYHAHAIAFQNHAVPHEPPADVWSWRLPTAFYVWRLIPINNGLNIYFIYLLLASVILLLSYKLSLMLVNNAYLAIIPSYLLYSYLHFASYDWTILQIEWWSMLFAIIAIYFIIKNKENFAILFFSLATITREQMLIPAFLIAVVNLIYRYKKWYKYWIPIICFGILFILHTYQINQIVSLSDGSRAFHLRLNGGLELLQNTLAFGSWEYIFFMLKPFAILFFLNGLSLVMVRGRIEMMLLSFFVLPISYLVIGTSSINQAWGVLYVPIILISTIFTIKLLAVSKFNKIKT